MREDEVIGDGTFTTGDAVVTNGRSGAGGGRWALLAGLGLGAAAMYLLDAGRGARRRHVLRDKAASSLRSGARNVREASVNARNHAMGVVASARGRLQHETVEDDVLVDRVRSQLGHHVEHPRAIEVFAEQGNVVLCGSLPADEIDRAVKVVESVRGVACVDNQLVPSAVDETGGTAA